MKEKCKWGNDFKEIECGEKFSEKGAPIRLLHLRGDKSLPTGAIERRGDVRSSGDRLAT